MAAVRGGEKKPKRRSGVVKSSSGNDHYSVLVGSLTTVSCPLSKLSATCLRVTGATRKLSKRDLSPNSCGQGTVLAHGINPGLLWLQVVRNPLSSFSSRAYGWLLVLPRWWTNLPPR
jgi:hypothetical protein